jgi:CMP-N-acetylneuraminic acid synthetase
MKIIGFIPAKGHSNRLKNKNIYPVQGKPLIHWTIEAAQKSAFMKDIYVSTDSDRIKKSIKKFQVNIIDRPNTLSTDCAHKQDVLEHAIPLIEKETGRVDIICMLQANSPQLQTQKIDEAIEKVLSDKKTVFECQSVNKSDLITDGAIRAFRRSCLKNKGLGPYLSVVLTDYIDVHTIEDIAAIEKILCMK